jgi:hypothetical protein
MLNRRDRHEAVRSQEGCMGTPSRNAVLGSIVVALVILGLTPSVGEAAVQPYGTNDAGGFRNVLPPGEDGVDNLSEALDFLGDGTYPEHWIDQQPLYEGLLYASPSLTDGQIPKYYKDATFGVRPNDVESRISPTRATASRMSTGTPTATSCSAPAMPQRPTGSS